MAVEILDAQDGDMHRLFEIASRAFGDREPFWNAAWPLHWSISGREAGARRFKETKNTDAKAKYMKAVETASGKIVGVAKWSILVNQTPDSSPADDKKRQRSNNDEDNSYLQYLSTQFFAERRDAIARSGGNIVCLDILAVDPDYQCRGIGSALVTWGTNKADELGLEAVVEGSSGGVRVYVKHGYMLTKRIQIEVPPEWAHLGGQSYSWLVRPKQR